MSYQMADEVAVEETKTSSLLSHGTRTRGDSSVDGLQHGRLRVVVLILLSMLSIGGYYAYDAPVNAKARLMSRLHIGETQFNWLYTSYSLPNIPLPIIWGVWVDRHAHSKRQWYGLAHAALLFTSAVCIGTFFVAVGVHVESYGLTLFGRCVFALGGESLSVVSTVMIALTFERFELFVAMGTSLAMARLSAVACTQTFAATDLSTSFWMTFFVSLGSVGSAMCLMYLDQVTGETFQEKNASNDDDVNSRATALTTVPQQQQRTFLSSLRVVSHSQTVLLAVITAFVYVVVLTWNSSATHRLMERFNVDSSTASTARLVPFVMSAALSPAIAGIIDRLGQLPMLLAMSSAGLVAVHILLMCAGDGEVIMYVILVLLGLSYCVLASALWPAFALVTPASHWGTVYGAATSLQNFFLLLGPITFGSVNVRDGSAMFTGLAIISVVLSLILHSKNSSFEYDLCASRYYRTLFEEPQNEMSPVQSVTDSAHVQINSSNSTHLSTPSTRNMSSWPVFLATLTVTVYAFWIAPFVVFMYVLGILLVPGFQTVKIIGLYVVVSFSSIVALLLAFNRDPSVSLYEGLYPICAYSALYAFAVCVIRFKIVSLKEIVNITFAPVQSREERRVLGLLKAYRATVYVALTGAKQRNLNVPWPVVSELTGCNSTEELLGLLRHDAQQPRDNGTAVAFAAEREHVKELLHGGKPGEHIKHLACLLPLQRRVLSDDTVTASEGTSVCLSWLSCILVALLHLSIGPLYRLRSFSMHAIPSHGLPALQFAGQCVSTFVFDLLLLQGVLATTTLWSAIEGRWTRFHEEAVALCSSDDHKTPYPLYMHGSQGQGSATGGLHCWPAVVIWLEFRRALHAATLGLHAVYYRLTQLVVGLLLVLLALLTVASAVHATTHGSDVDGFDYAAVLAFLALLPLLLRILQLGYSLGSMQTQHELFLEHDIWKRLAIHHAEEVVMDERDRTVAVMRQALRQTQLLDITPMLAGVRLNGNGVVAVLTAFAAAALSGVTRMLAR